MTALLRAWRRWRRVLGHAEAPVLARRPRPPQARDPAWDVARGYI
ncbi:hypothetical protein [Caulobacter soli]|nr:hypothetical protein [Caulobacter soli]